MSPWALEPAPSSDLTAPRIPAWTKVLPLVLSALLFLSGFFAPFAPLPLIHVSLQGRRFWAAIAAFTNAAIVYELGGKTSFALFFLFVVVLAAALAEALRFGMRVERAALATIVAVLAAAGLWITVQANGSGVSPAVELRTQVDGLVMAVEQSLSERARQALIESAGAPEAEPGSADWRKAFVSELPSAFLIFTLLMVWSNLWLTLRLNSGRVRERVGVSTDYFRQWKSPEWLVWPTILAGFVLVFGSWLKVSDLTTAVAINLFKVLMAVYVMQGLSILSYCMTAWKVNGFFRGVAFLAAIFAMIPLVLSLGFFDLWFDFRAKIRQS